jgi:hypothetical protein
MHGIDNLKNNLVMGKATFGELKETLMAFRKKETELRQSEKALYEKERYFRSLISNTLIESIAEGMAFDLGGLQ